MILANGKIFPSSEQDKILSELEEGIAHTLSKGGIDVERVISAADSLCGKILSGELDVTGLVSEEMSQRINQAAVMFGRESLEYRVKTELDITEHEYSPMYGINRVRVRPMPLGVIFHIAAGNADGLPALSVLEGLLSGNINILKLPQADNGLSLRIFEELIKAEPSLSEYIYVFDTPSADVEAMKRMSELADGIAVWGGDAAVAAVRRTAPIGARLIEWGHKLGFAYVSGYTACELEALAEHIISTKQLLCSSCQTIFVDTDDMNELRRFADEFLPVLEKAAGKAKNDMGICARKTLKRYNAMLERAIGCDDGTVYGQGCSVKICGDSYLELSDMYGSCLIKKLPERDIISVLRKSKGYLQTAGLICSPEKRSRLTDILVRCGVNRIMTAGNMSVSFQGEAHDGEYPLRRYSRIVNIEL